jgi:nucleoside phosphorylase
MSMPDKARKYGVQAVIEPARVIQERKEIGLHPSGPVPAGAIMCYDTAFWQWVCAGSGNVECDGWLKGAYLVPHRDAQVLVLKVPGFGAPTAVMTLEELIAFGINRFVNLGTAGGLQAELSVGDLVICDRAIRDEGTSHHYVPFEKYAYSCPGLTENLRAAAERQGRTYRKSACGSREARRSAPQRHQLDH